MHPWCAIPLQYLTYADFQPLLDCILQLHPGLEFLKETSEFQKKYAETVVYRIFYSLNRWVAVGCNFTPCRR